MNILVPTDFSKFAEYAFNAACKIASYTEGHLHLYHCADLPDDWEDLPIERKLEDKQNKNKALEVRHQLMALQDRATNIGLKSSIHFTGGKFLDNITEILEKVSIDLIVMGSHGVSGKEEWFLGSNSQKVIRKIRKNALIIKAPVETFKVNRVAFVSSLNLDDQEAFKTFLKFVTIFEPKEVHVLSIDTSSWFAQPPMVMLDALKDFKEIARTYKCKTHFYRDHSVQSGIRHFIEEHNINLVGISYRSRNPIKRIFLGSNVEMLVNHAEVPVLCIND